jgi:hypothetical protein
MSFTAWYLDFYIVSSHKSYGVSFGDVLIFNWLIILKFRGSQEESLMINRGVDFSFYQCFDLRDKSGWQDQKFKSVIFWGLDKDFNSDSESNCRALDYIVISYCLWGLEEASTTG